MQIKDLDQAEAERVAALLDEALDLPLAERGSWQATLSQREPRLSKLVADLLSVISASPGEALVETRDLIARQFARTAEIPSLEGRIFGPYRVVRLLGRGGMGSVWLAERSDGLFSRQVALKLVNASLTGPSLAERFARERSILATLNHPYIARLLDAGVSEDGQHYLAIEYVEGTPLTVYCDEHKLSIDERIDLLLQVLAAVRHAHQNLTIHRDLKPSNILVTSERRVRLLDFGIAKLLTEGEAQESELTQLGGVALTPEYASPEQIAGQPVSTASDVYSCGVLLYALLCGQRPYHLPRESRAALEQAILTVDPTKPSQQVISEEAAVARASTPRKLAQSLAGDLDTITLKALKKLPGERYATADAFMQDLQRYLTGLPVLARPDGATYRLRKLIARNKMKFAVAAAVVLVLIAATAVSLRQAQIARAQAVVAQTESKRAQAVQGFLLDIFKTNTVQQSDPQKARQTTARELLDAGAKRVAENLKDSPEAQADVLDTLADMYFQLGLFEEAGYMRMQRVAILKTVHGANDVRVAEALLAFARDVSSSDARGQADAAFAEARRILDASAETSAEAHGRLWIESANMQQYLSIPEMRHAAKQALRFYRAHPYDWGLFNALQVSARACFLAGDYECAQTYHRDALAEAERQMPGPTSWIITPLVQLAEAETSALKFKEAEQHYLQALDITRRLNGELSGHTLQTQAKVGGFLFMSGRRAEGRNVLEDAQEKIKRPEANATPDAVGFVNLFQAMTRITEGRLPEVEPFIAAEVADLRAHYADSLPLSRALHIQATLFTALGRYEASSKSLDEAWTIWRRAGGDAVEAFTGNRFLFEQAQVRLAQNDAEGAISKLKQVAARPNAERLPFRQDEFLTHLGFAQAYLQLDRALDAQVAAEQALQLIQRSTLRDFYQTLEADASLRLGQAERDLGHLREARARIEHAVRIREALDAPMSPWLAEARIALAECLMDSGNAAQARTLLARAHSGQAMHRELGEHFRSPLRASRARLNAAR